MPRTFRSLLLLSALALGHATLTVGLVAITFGSRVAQLETGTTAPIGVRLANMLATVLAFPLLPLVTRLPLTLRPQGFPGEQLVFLANSVIWALAILSVWRWVHIWRARSTGSG